MTQPNQTTQQAQPQVIGLATDLINALLGYLAKRPYDEVFPFIQGIQNQAAPQVAAFQASQTTDTPAEPTGTESTDEVTQ